MDNLSSPFVSVIVPVFNDAERLKTCLEALEAQTYPKSLYEVIVVDNASDEGQDIKGVVAQFSQAIAAYESQPGSYAARNRGISLTKGEVIAFTDADCIPTADWIEKGVEILLKTPSCGLVAGEIEIFFRDPSCPTPAELYESVAAFHQKQWLEKEHWGATANLFTWKQVIERVGNFDATLKSAGDLEWGNRVATFGYEQIYTKEACVAHPARSSLKEIYLKNLRVIGGLYELQNKKYQSQLLRNWAFIFAFIVNIIPPCMFVYNAFLDSRLQKIEHKIKASSVMFLIRYISAWELLRLRTGKTVSRV